MALFSKHPASPSSLPHALLVSFPPSCPPNSPCPTPSPHPNVSWNLGEPGGPCVCGVASDILGSKVVTGFPILDCWSSHYHSAPTSLSTLTLIVLPPLPPSSPLCSHLSPNPSATRCAFFLSLPPHYCAPTSPSLQPAVLPLLFPPSAKCANLSLPLEPTLLPPLPPSSSQCSHLSSPQDHTPPTSPSL